MPLGSPTFSTSEFQVGSASGVFSGSQNLVIGDVAKLEELNEVTLICWVNFTALTTRQTLIGKELSYKIKYHSDDDRIQFFTNGTTGWATLPAPPNLVKAGVWSHLAAVYDGTTKKILHNGTVVATNSSTTGILPNNEKSFIIGSYDGGERLNGRLDDCSVWNKALSISDIALIYNRQKQKFAGIYESPIIDMGAANALWTNFSAVTTLPFLKELPGITESENSSNYSELGMNLSSGLIALWHMNENAWNGSANEVKDSSGNNLHGTANISFPTTISPGKLGRASSFNGSQGVATLVNNQVNGISEFTFSTWVRFNTLGAYKAIFHKGPVSSGERLMLVTGSGGGTTNLWAIVSDTTLKSGYASNVLKIGEWQHLTMVFDGNQTGNSNRLKLYINGRSEPMTFNHSPIPSVTPTSSEALSLGYESIDTAIDGSLDEVAVWSRALSQAEVLELYRRGANRVKYQVRSCTESSCACKSYNTSPAGSALDCDGDGIANSEDFSDSYAADWIGPDGSTSTYFSELQSNTSVDSSGNPTGQVKSTGLNLDWSGSFFASAANPVNNRYFQYRVFMESDDENNLCSTAPCTPEVTSISIGPTGRYYGGSPSIINKTAVSFTQLKSINKSDTNSCTSYQLSNDGGTTWKWWDGSQWANTTQGITTANNMTDFTNTRLQLLSSGNFKFKAFLNTNSSNGFNQSCELSSLHITSE